MKLHLPKLLRNSVLACITAAAGIATSTVGTATFIGGVAAFTLTQQQVQASSLTKIADMATLVDGATIHESVVNTSGEGYTSYKFNGQGAITNISNAAVLEAITSTSTTNYLTVAAWVKVDATSGVQSIFGYGGQSTGVKFATNGSSLAFTTKGVADVSNANVGLVAGNWSLVAITFCLDNTENDRYLFGPTDDTFYTRNFSQMNEPAEADRIFAIGSGNGGDLREAFSGEIQNLTIFTSTELVNNSAIAEIMGTTAPSLLSIPTLTWDTAAADNTWSGSSWKTKNNTTASWSSEYQAVFAGNGETVTLSGEISALAVRVTGEGWKWVGDGTLDVTDSIVIGDGSTATSLDISGLTNVPVDGMTVNAGATLLIGGKTMTFDGTHRMHGKVVIGNGGIVTVSTASAATSYIDGEVEIQQGGKLQLLGGNDRTGYGSTSTEKISILNGTLEMSGRQTWSGILEMKGGATVTASAEPGTGDENAPAFETYDGSFVAEGTGNKIEESVNFWTNRAVTVEVKDGGDLEIAGRVAVRVDNGSSVTKTGAGTLKFTNDGENGNSFAKVYNQQAGTTIISGTDTTFSGGINITGGTFRADTGIILGGTITNAGTLVLNGNVTVAEGSLDNFAHVEGELTGTTNGLTDYEVYYTVLDGAANTGSTTTVTYGGQSFNLADVVVGTKQGYVIAEGAVNVGGSSPAADTAAITRFYIGEGGTMNLSTREEGAALTAEQVLLQATGTGTIAVQTDMVLAGRNNGAPAEDGRKEIAGWNTPNFTGTIAVQAGTLKLGDAGTVNNCYSLDLSQIKSLDMDGGGVRAFVAGTTISTVNVKKAGTFEVFQASQTGVTDENPAGNPGLLIDNMVLADDLNLNITWRSAVVIKSLSGEGAFRVNSTRQADLSIESVDGAGPISLNGGTLSTTLGVDADSQLKLGGTITTSKPLVVNGRITISGDMDNYTLLEAGTFTDEMSAGTDGYRGMKGATYLLLDNNCVSDGTPAPDAVTWNAGMTANYGSGTVTLTKDETTGDISFSGGNSFDTIYYVNTKDVTMGGENATEDSDRATGFVIADGRKVTIAGAASTTAAGELVFNTTGSGTIEILTDTTMPGISARTEGASPRATQFTGIISVKNGTLNIADEGATPNKKSVDLRSVKAIQMDGGNIRFHGADSHIGKVVVNQAGTFSFQEADGSVRNENGLSIAEIALNDDLAFNGTWGTQFAIAKLSGTGDIRLNKGAFGSMSGRIDAIAGCGALTNNGVNLTIGTDTNTVLSIGGTITNTNHADSNLTVNGKVVISRDLGNFTVAQLGTESDTLSKGTDGYREVTGSTYYLLDNAGSADAVTWNAGDKASYNGGEVALTMDAETGDITFVGGTALGTTYYVNTQDITIGGGNASDDTDRATALAIADGRTVTIAGTADAASLLKNTTAAAGSTVVVDSELTTPIYLNADMTNLAGTLDIQGGRVVVGGANTGSSGANVAFTPAKLIVGDGGEFTSNFGQGADTPKEIATAIDLQSGAKLSNVDGHMKYTGAIRFNADGAGYNAGGVVTLDSFWGKNLELAGLLEGAGTVQLLNTRATVGGVDQHVNFKISGGANTFSGTYKLADGTEGTSENDTINLYVLNENALKGASVNMASTTCKSNLYLETSSELVSLDGADADNSVKANAAAVTLTVSKGNYGGRMENSGDNVLSLTKKGTDTLTLGGTIGYTGATTVQGGTLAFTGTGALTLGSISTVGSAQITTASALTLAAGSALTMDLAGATTANALIGVGAGTFSITDETCAITLTNADSLEDGAYKLISWAAANDALTLEKFNITGVEFGEEYALKIENNALILTKESGDTLSWDVANDTWAVGSAFAPAGSEKVNFEADDTAVFSGVASGTTEEAVAIKGTISATSVTITPGEGNTYSFSSHSEGGQLTTSKLSIGAGTVSFGSGSLNVANPFTQLSVDDKGVLDLTQLGTGLNATFKSVAPAATGDGTIKIAGSSSVGSDAAELLLLDIAGQTYTTGVNYSITNGVAIHGGQKTSETEKETLSIARKFEVGGEMRIESGATVEVVSGGVLETAAISLGHASANGNTTYGHLVLKDDGSIKADSIVKASGQNDAVNTFTMTGGTLELTGEGGIAAGITTDIQGGKLVANTADWSIAGATISGGVEISGANTITLTDTQLKGTLTNNGSLALAGTINIAPSAGFQTQVAGEQFSGTDGNGFKFADVTYTLASGTGTISVADGAAWQLDGTAAANATYAEGKLNVKGAQQGTLYWANTGTVTYGEAGIAGATGIALNGGSVALDASLADSMTAGLDVKAAGTVTLGEDAELAASQVNGATATNKVTLAGSGTYDLGSGIELGAGVGLGESWQGTVETSVSSITTDTTLALGDKVAFTADKVTLGADLSTGGALTMGALEFASLDSLLTVGGELNIGSISLDKSILASTTEGVWTLASTGSVAGDATLSTDGLTGLGVDGLYDYALSWDGTTLKLTGTMNADFVWAEGDESFGDSEDQEWAQAPGMEGANVAFTGSCNSDETSGTAGQVNVADDGVKVNNVTVTTKDEEGAQSDYTFVGGDLQSTGDLKVLSGSGLTVSNNTSFEGSATVSASSSLAVGDSGSLTVEGNLTIEAPAEEGKTGGSLSISSTGTLAAGSLSTDKLTITGTLDETAATLVTVGDLVKDVVIDLDDATTLKTIAAGTYSLMSILGNVTEVTLDAGDLQAILAKGLGCDGLSSSAGASTFSLRSTPKTEIYLDVRELEAEELIWNTDATSSTGKLEIGTVNDDGAIVLKNNAILDSIQTVNVAQDTTIDLSGSDDTDTVNINGLSGTRNLSIVGNDDAVAVAANGYKGTLSLDKVAASVSGTAGSVLAKADTKVDLAVSDTEVLVGGKDVTLTGTMEGGSLSVSDGATMKDSTLQIDGTDIGITKSNPNEGMAMVVAEGDTLAIADLDGVSGSAGDITVGWYDAEKGEYVQSALYAKYFDTDSYKLVGGKVMADRNTSYYTDKAGADVSANGAAGLAMADAVLVKLNPQAAEKPGDLAAVLTALDTATGTAADELGASLAGASTAVLGMAALGDVDRQLQAIRNRTTTMGVDQSVVNEEMPYFNAWINAEGDRSELSESGTESGYELNSWGGTVGFDVDFCPTLTAGMALTAMYGDLDTTGADKATGDLDSYYVSAFARYAPSAWTHTFVATIGKSDISLDRTVAGQQVSGETDGMSFGLMYEVGRVYALNEDGSTCLQPVFNVSWKHTTVDAYTEEGSDLGLEVDEQTLDTVTVGLGARLQTVVGESMYNRTSILEARVMAKADAGDRSGSSDVALSALPGATASVDSAERGTFGLEAGAGLTIPLGQESGSLFMDASVELRSDYTNVNGTVGYRLNF